jgi:uroporphyrinogen-III decarboxylase
MAISSIKIQERLETWCSGDGIEFVNQAAKEAFVKRTRRIADAIQLRKPDSVPVVPMWEYFYARYAKISCYDALYNLEMSSWAIKKAITELAPDAYQAPIFFGVGQLLDALDVKDLKWPGHGLGFGSAHQYVEGEYMRADEYEDLINDPSDFMLRRYVPRVCGNLKAFEALLPLRNLFTYSNIYPSLFPLATEEGLQATRKLMEAAQASFNYIKFLNTIEREMSSLGFSAWAGTAALAPFDAISTTLRGTHGTAMDIYRQPEVLKAACEKFVWILLDRAISTANFSRVPIVFIPLNKGTATTRDGKGGFLSIPQFEEFYWPTLKKVILGLIDNGLVPNLLIEGDFTSRLEIIKDVPPGTCIFHFENVDIYKVKKILGDRVCIRGSVPARTLILGTPQDVKDACKELIDVLGDGGGFIMDASMATEDVKPENMRTMIEFTREYGVYK